MKSLRILIASQIYSDGSGQGGFATRLAENLAARGHTVRVLMPSDRPLSYSVMINSVQVDKVAAIHMSILHPAIHLTPTPGTRVRKIFGEFVPDIVHVQDHHLLSQAVVREARRLHLPLVGTNHFLPENLLPFLIRFPRIRTLAGRLLWNRMLQVFNQLDAVTTPSKAAAAILHEKKLLPPVFVISNGVDTERFFPSPMVDRKSTRQKFRFAPDQPLFLYVGRLDAEKRVDILLRAAAALKDSQLQLAIAGDGLVSHRLQQLARQLGLNGQVRFLGYVPTDELPALYAAADAFVMPSPEELQSIATLEASACGKPILAADARALPELVTHTVNGYLFAAASADDTARWMKAFLDAPEQWQHMGDESLARSQLHNIKNTIQSYENCYRSVLEKLGSVENSIYPQKYEVA